MKKHAGCTYRGQQWWSITGNHRWNIMEIGDASMHELFNLKDTSPYLAAFSEEGDTHLCFLSPFCKHSACYTPWLAVALHVELLSPLSSFQKFWMLSTAKITVFQVFGVAGTIIEPWHTAQKASILPFGHGYVVYYMQIKRFSLLPKI